ncbi:PREDICTED: uncharacterized protein LOC109475555 [Branchiostoma belcheri]|uniref:Uncharacterized protein LOC109475555 n=1 Tax=Branchiostoma belcheri TaxID=7741 RepID=A0A6P4ZCZ5_BRABE|nr:PREDICTED: uncharacterized protein LOC109475555 [Branchiostoma belcheri]
MMHFRSSTLKTVESHLKKAWQQCLDEDVTIPLRKVYLYDKTVDRNLIRINLTDFLSPVSAEDTEEEVPFAANTDLTALEEDEEPAVQVQERDDPHDLPALEHHTDTDSEQTQVMESGLQAALEKENQSPLSMPPPCENALDSSKTPREKE